MMTRCWASFGNLSSVCVFNVFKRGVSAVRHRFDRLTSICIIVTDWRREGESILGERPGRRWIEPAGPSPSVVNQGFLFVSVHRLATKTKRIISLFFGQAPAPA